MKTWIAILLLLATVLAGCADDTPVEEEEDPFTDLDLEADEETGIIRGIVVDETISPIAEATVTIKSTGQSATSDENGAFGFAGLTPGTYFLEAAKIGFESITTDATVVAGEDKPDIVKIILPAKPEDLPYYTPSTYTGYVACAALVGIYLIGAEDCNVGGVFGEDDARVWFQTEPRVADYVQIEVDWEAVQIGGDRMTLTAFTCDLEGACDSDGNRICQVWGGTPQTCKVNKTLGHGNPDGTGACGGPCPGTVGTGWGAGTDPGFVVWMGGDCAEVACVPGTAIGVGFMWDQTFTVYNHVFYNYEPDPEWYFLTDGDPPGPQ